MDNRSGHGWLVGPTPQLFLSESQLSPFPISGQICHNSLVVWLGCHLYVDDMKRLDSGMEIGETWILAEPVTHEPWQGTALERGGIGTEVAFRAYNVPGAPLCSDTEPHERRLECLSDTEKQAHS